MSFHRTMLVAVAALTATGVTSGAFACGIYGCGGPYAVTFTPPAAVYAAPVVYGLVPSYQVVPLFQAPVVYQPPVVYQVLRCSTRLRVVEYTPLVPQPIGVAAWDTGGAGAYAAPGVEVAPEAYAGEQPYYGGEQPYYGGEQPYVVNQGPDYRGPGLMVPDRTWSPRTGLAAPDVSTRTWAIVTAVIRTWVIHTPDTLMRARPAPMPVTRMRAIRMPAIRRITRHRPVWHATRWPDRTDGARTKNGASRATLRAGRAAVSRAHGSRYKARTRRRSIR